MFERSKQPLLSRKKFLIRMFQSSFLATAILTLSLLGGMVGYHFLAHLTWIDSLLNASMILTGMGPVNILQSSSAKIFASFYALFSGIIFLSSSAILVSPVLHRFLHHFHLEIDKD